MTCGLGKSLARSTALAAMLFARCLPNVFAEQREQEPGKIDENERVSQPAGEPLTDFETMELHLRRYSAAANNMAQLFKQLNQSIQQVSLAAKTAEVKSSSHNRRLLEEKLRQLENTRASLDVQHAQLQSQMQNEYRSYAALSSRLRVKYDNLQDLHNQVEAARAAREAKGLNETKDAKGKPAKGKSKPRENRGTTSEEAGARQ